MTGRDFVACAEQFAKGSSEAELRSAVSRAYYGAFHEACTVAIGKRLVGLLRPKWLRIGGYFHPRGGMPIDVFWQAGKLPKGVWVPEQGIATYRARI